MGGEGLGSSARQRRRRVEVSEDCQGAEETARVQRKLPGCRGNCQGAEEIARVQRKLPGCSGNCPGSGTWRKGMHLGASLQPQKFCMCPICPRLMLPCLLRRKCHLPMPLRLPPRICPLFPRSPDDLPSSHTPCAAALALARCPPLRATTGQSLMTAVGMQTGT